MNNNTMELNLNEMEMIAGGPGAGIGFCAGAVGGGIAGGILGLSGIQELFN